MQSVDIVPRADTAAEAPTDPIPKGPQWPRQAARAVFDEITAFLFAAWAMTLHPRRFAEQWRDGTTKALNPVGFLATSLAVRAAGDEIMGVLLDGQNDGSRSLLGLLGDALGPYVYWMMLGATCHFVFRLLGSPMPLRSSMGITLYAGGGPATLAWILVCVEDIVITCFVNHAPSTHFNISGLHGGPVMFSWAFFFLATACFYVPFALALAGLHGVSRWRGLLIVLIITAGLALYSGWAMRTSHPDFAGFHFYWWRGNFGING